MRDQIVRLEKEKASALEKVRKTLITVHGPPREVRILARGNWQDDSGEVVQPAVPHFIAVDAQGVSYIGAELDRLPEHSDEGACLNDADSVRQ